MIQIRVLLLDIIQTVEPYADILELGIPFSDPIADGSVIQAADQRALSQGTAFMNCFDLITQVRQITEKPIVLLTYANILGVGEVRSQTIQQLAACGIDGIVAADIPYEESADLIEDLNQNHMCLIPLAAPTTNSERMEKIIANGQGFLYLVAVKGVTGARESLLQETVETLQRINALKSSNVMLPICVGFGISTPEHVTQILQLGADGVIVGSALIKNIEENLDDPNQMLEKIEGFVKQMKDATFLYLPEVSDL